MSHTTRFLLGCSGLSLLLLIFGLVGSPPLARAVPQGEVDVSPDATPEIRQVKPNRAAAGDEVTLAIEGRNFSPGVYISFSNPAVHAVSMRRISASQLEARVAIGRKAPFTTISLYVSNPASSVAEAPFTIVNASAPPSGPGTPSTRTTEIQPSQAGTPEVVAVDPSRAVRGSQVSVKVTGRNFSKGVRVSFSNPGIRVLETSSSQSTELAARIQVANDAPAGKASLFVVNPDDREAEVAFEVVEANPVTTTTTKTPTAETGGSASQRFEVINLGEGVSILQNPNKTKGTLTLAGGRLKYEEGGKEVFTAVAGEIKEIEANVFLGVNTGTFHVILNSGKTFNFVAASLRPADSQSIVGSLRSALK